MEKISIIKGISKLRQSIILQPIAIILVLVSFASAISALGNSIRLWCVLAIIGSFIGIVAMYLMRSGFVKLKTGNKKYRIGTTGAAFQIIGLALCLVVFALILAGTYNAAYIVLSHFIPQSTRITSGILLSIALIMIIGTILTMIGFWRIGSEYDNDLVKAGAFLYIFIGILIDLVLLYIGLGDIKKKLQLIRP